MPLIDPGTKAPAFKLPDQAGKAHALADYAGKPLVLYFYPKDDTDGCTKQACQFRDALPDFSKLGAAVLGVSPDSADSHAKFVAKQKLTFTLLADEPPSEKAAPPICDRFGVWQEKSMYGRKYMGVVRTTYLIGPDGKVARRWDKVSVPGHAAEVLEAVREVGGDAAAATTKKGARKSPAAPKPPAKPTKAANKPAARAAKRSKAN